MITLTLMDVFLICLGLLTLLINIIGARDVEVFFALNQYLFYPYFIGISVLVYSLPTSYWIALPVYLCTAVLIAGRLLYWKKNRAIDAGKAMEV